MNLRRRSDRRTSTCLVGVCWLVWALASCTDQERDRLQGYVEGEFVYIASPFAGALESLQVQRGAQVKSGDSLFW